MKIIVISTIPSHPTTEGNRKLILSYSQMLKDLGHEVYFLFIKPIIFNKLLRNDYIISEQEMIKYWGNNLFIVRQSILNKLLYSIKTYFRRFLQKGYYHIDDFYFCNISKTLDLLNEKYKFDACIVNYFYLSKILLKTKIKRKALFTHDYFCYKNLLLDMPSLWNITAHEEAKALQRAPFIFAMQDEEAILFEKLSPKSIVLRNYNICKYVPQKIVGNHNILFLSGPNIYNINGLNWFLNNIFPEILKCFPDTKLLIGGAICDKVKHLKNTQHIELQGYVDSPEAFYSQGDIVINPTFQGTGLKIKTFESLAFDKITMVHPHSTIGIYNKHHSPIFESTQPQQWCEFLRKIWCKNSELIIEIKELNSKYINSMNLFIINEFNRFLNHNF